MIIHKKCQYHLTNFAKSFNDLFCLNFFFMFWTQIKNFKHHSYSSLIVANKSWRCNFKNAFWSWPYDTPFNTKMQLSCIRIRRKCQLKTKLSMAKINILKFESCILKVEIYPLWALIFFYFPVTSKGFLFRERIIWCFMLARLKLMKVYDDMTFCFLVSIQEARAKVQGFVWGKNYLIF
jgi:hypothetical protein